MANEKYALLDTDFISKMHLIRKDDHNKLIDKIMAMPGYCFYCHKQIQVEIMRHNIAGAPEWFQSKIESKSNWMNYQESMVNGLSAHMQECLKLRAMHIKMDILKRSLFLCLKWTAAV